MDEHIGGYQEFAVYGGINHYHQDYLEGVQRVDMEMTNRNSLEKLKILEHNLNKTIDTLTFHVAKFLVEIT